MKRRRVEGLGRSNDGVERGGERSVEEQTKEPSSTGKVARNVQLLRLCLMFHDTGRGCRVTKSGTAFFGANFRC